MLSQGPMKKIFWLAVFVIWTSDLWAQSSFYQGKTVTVVAAASAGSLYDLYARLVAQFIGKHIPGNPNFIVQNMPGAGSIIGANYIYNVVKPDGLSIGAVQPSIYFNQIQKQAEVKYDWAKFTWIGSTDKSDYLLYMRADLDLTKAWRTCAGPKNRQNAAQPGPALPAAICPSCWKKLSAQNLSSLPAIRVVERSTWQWSGENFTAALSRFRPIIRASPTIPGVKPASRAF